MTTLPNLKEKARPALFRIENAIEDLRFLILDLDIEGDTETAPKVVRTTDDIEDATRTLQVLIESASE